MIPLTLSALILSFFQLHETVLESSFMTVKTMGSTASECHSAGRDLPKTLRVSSSIIPSTSGTMQLLAFSTSQKDP